MIAGLPLADPQFWVVTAGAVAVVAIWIWRARVRARRPAPPACANCAREEAHGRRAGRTS
ncbi:MAG: hypothetical protein U0X73_10085 [Thermoanaerobaculia bacterium]